jgi:hypothetical protein
MSLAKDEWKFANRTRNFEPRKFRKHFEIRQSLPGILRFKNKMQCLGSEGSSYETHGLRNPASSFLRRLECGFLCGSWVSWIPVLEGITRLTQ